MLAVVADGDEAVWQGVAKEAGKPGCDLVWGQLLDLHRAFEARQGRAICLYCCDWRRLPSIQPRAIYIISLYPGAC